MRIDKFLWCIRKFKTRSKATEAIRKGLVSIGDDQVKASREVQIDDEIKIRKDGIYHKIRVLNLPKSRVGAKLVEQYSKDITSPEELEKMEFSKMMYRLNRPKGLGRPTKKERRDLDGFMGDVNH